MVKFCYEWSIYNITLKFSATFFHLGIVLFHWQDDTVMKFSETFSLNDLENGMDVNLFISIFIKFELLISIFIKFDTFIFYESEYKNKTKKQQQFFSFKGKKKTKHYKCNTTDKEDSLCEFGICFLFSIIKFVYTRSLVSNCMFEQIFSRY